MIDFGLNQIVAGFFGYNDFSAPASSVASA